MPTLAALDVWRGIGFWALFFLATLVALPQELYAAAHLDGANAWQRFRYLTIPLIRGPLLFALVIATIYTLQVFDSVFVLTDGSPAGATQTLVWYIYKALFQFDNVGLGATLSMLLLRLHPDPDADPDAPAAGARDDVTAGDDAGVRPQPEPRGVRSTTRPRPDAGSRDHARSASAGRS